MPTKTTWLRPLVSDEDFQNRAVRANLDSMLRLALLVVMAGCSHATERADADLRKLAEIAPDMTQGAAPDMESHPSDAATPDMATADLLVPVDMVPPADLTPCGGPSQTCCGGATACDQTAAHNVAWFGTVCLAGTCQHCGGDGFKGFGGPGNLCCDAPNRCIAGDACTTTGAGPVCE